MRNYFLLLFSFILYVADALGQPLYYRSSADGNWNQASTWEISNDFENWGPASFPPDASNPNTLDITIKHTVTVSTNVTADQVFVDTLGRLRITANTFTIANGGEPFDITIGGAIELTGGQIIGAGQARIQKIMDWNGGTNGVQTVVDTGATMNISGTVTLQNILAVNGTANHANGSIFFQNGTVNLNGTWNENPGTGNQFGNSSGTNIFAIGPNGKLYKFGNQTFTNNVPATIAGEVAIQTGLYIAQNNTTCTGIINIGDAGTFRQSANIIFDPGAEITGEGDYSLVNGFLNVNEDLLFENVTLAVSGGTIIAFDGKEIFILGGETEDDLIINGGTINGPIILDVGANAAITNGFNLQDIFTVNGLVNHTAGSIFFQDGIININGVWNETPGSNNQFGNTSGSNLVNINSSGFFNKGAGTTFVSNVPFVNTGTMNVHAGTWIYQNTTTNEGNVGVDTLAFLQNNHTFIMDTTGYVTGSGTFVQNSGTLLMNSPVTFPPGMAFNINGGVINGDSPLTVAGTANWGGGTISCPFSVAPGATCNVPGGANIILQDIITNYGTVHYSGQNLNFQNGKILNKNTWNLSSSGTFQFSNNSGINSVDIDTTGKNIKLGSGSFFNNVPTTNHGSIEVIQGLFSHGMELINQGRIKVNSGTIFQANNTLKLEAGTFFEGSGLVRQNTGNLQVNTPVTLADDMGFELGGTAKTVGNSPLTIKGTMIWAGSMESPIIIDVLRKIETSPGTIPLLKNNLLIKGTAEIKEGSSVSFQGGTMQVDTTGLLRVGSNVATPASQFSNTSGTNKLIILNGGTVQKIGSQSFTSFISTDVEGEIKIDNGTFIQNGGTVELRKIFQAGLDAIMRFNPNSTLNINTGAAMNGAGNYEFLGTVNVKTDFEFPKGSNVFFKSGSWLSGGALQVKISGNYNWESGSSNVITAVESGGLFKTTGLVAKNFNNNLIINSGGVGQFGGTNLNFNNAQVDIFGELQVIPILGNPMSIQNTTGSGFNFKSGAILRSFNPTGVTNFNMPLTFQNGVIGGVGTQNYSAPLTGQYAITSGFSPGVLVLNSVSPLFSDLTDLQIEVLNGSGPGTGHDQLQRNGNLVLDGTLNVFQTGAVPLGTYTIISLNSGSITGSFDFVNLPPGYTIGQTSSTMFVTKTADILWKFRSKQNGNWNELSTWESSVNGMNWSNATQKPSPYNAEVVYIRSNHTINITTNTDVNQLIAESGGIINILAGTLNILK